MDGILHLRFLFYTVIAPLSVTVSSVRTWEWSWKLQRLPPL